MELFLERQSRMSILSYLGWASSFPVMPKMSSLGAFFGRRSSLIFLQKGNFIFVGKGNTIFPCIFWEIPSFNFRQIYHIFEKEECHLSWWYKKDHNAVRFFWKYYIFRTFEENIIFPYIFWERSSFISVKRIR